MTDAYIPMVGWFDSAEQTKPAFDPPRDGPCIACGKPLVPHDVVTHCLIREADQARSRSFFYRTHRTCRDREGGLSYDGRIFDLIDAGVEG